MISVELGGKLVNRLVRDTIAEAIKFYRLDPNIGVVVDGWDVDQNDSHAGCIHTGELEYQLYLNSNVEFPATRIVQLIGHEMTHVKQYELDGLEDHTGRTIRFRRKYYRLANKMEYWLSPWEMEARAMEDFFCYQMGRHEHWHK